MFSDRSPYDEARGKGLGKMVDDVLYCLFFALSANISSMFSFAQFIMFSTSGRKERARGVRLYSTRGGVREDFTAYEAVFLEGAERLCERLLRDVGHLTLQFLKTHRLLVL